MIKVIPLKLLPNEKGRLMEVQSRDDSHFLGFGQTYITSTRRGGVKAWYRHHKQTDQIAAINGLFKLVLYDPASTELMEIVMGELAPKLVQIPPGIWHGFQNIGETEAFLLHLNSEPFHLSSPDEDRLDYRSQQIPYTWPDLYC